MDECLDSLGLPLENKQAINSLMQAIDMSDTTLTFRYGAALQREIASVCDMVIDVINNLDIASLSEFFGQIMVKISSVLKKKKSKGLFRRRGQVEYTIDTSNLEGQLQYIDSIEKDLRGYQLRLLKYSALLDIMRERNEEYCKDIALRILAGKEKLKGMGTSNQNTQFCGGFEIKIKDLEVTYIISLHLDAQIQIIWSNIKTILDKLKVFLYDMLPTLRKQILLFLELECSKEQFIKQRASAQNLNEDGSDLVQCINNILTVSGEWKHICFNFGLELNRIESKLKE